MRPSVTINGVMKRLLWFAGEQYSIFFYLRRNAKAGPPKVLDKFGPGGPIGPQRVEHGQLGPLAELSGAQLGP